jgi:hypothetical protein
VDGLLKKYKGREKNLMDKLILHTKEKIQGEKKGQQTSLMRPVVIPPDPPRGQEGGEGLKLKTN